MNLQKLKQSGPQWLLSFVVHGLMLGFLAHFYIAAAQQKQVELVVSELRTETAAEDFHESLSPDEAIKLEEPSANIASATLTNVSSVVSAKSQGGGGGSALGSLTEQVQEQIAAASVGNRSITRPLYGDLPGLKLDSSISGAKGINEFAGSNAGGDSGAMDRITQEVLRQLNKNKVLVAWVFDSSGSLKERRKSISERFEKIYKQLETLGVTQYDGLMSAVVSTGQQTRFLLREPTSDVAKIRAAIQTLKEDESGVENYFTAIRETAAKYRRFQTVGKRTLLIVLITDEIGDDRASVDETYELLKRNGVIFYAMGPDATFSRPVIHDTWTHPKTGYVYWTPIDRGPYTREEEILRVPFEESAYQSGFGPFALSKLTRETGGIFFLYSDNRVNGTRYDQETLIPYRSDYGTAADHAKEIAKSHFRSQLMEVVRQGNAIWHTAFPNGIIFPESLSQDLAARQRDIAEFLNFARKAIPMLKALEGEFEKETNVRWKANYDLSYARLLNAKVRCDEFNWSAADLKLHPRIIQDKKKNNAFSYTLVDAIRVGTKDGTKVVEASRASKRKKGESKQIEDARTLHEKALMHFKRVVEQHPNTPWAVAAAREMQIPVGVDWQEIYWKNKTLTEAERKAYSDGARDVPKK